MRANKARSSHGCRSAKTVIRRVRNATEGSWISERGQVRKLTALARLPQVGVRASGFYFCNAPFPHQPAHDGFATLLNAFGPRRFYWGSDFNPVLEFDSFAQTIGVLDSLHLSDANCRLILGDNLRRLLQARRIGSFLLIRMFQITCKTSCGGTHRSKY
jgi:Amidohydrolase